MNSSRRSLAVAVGVPAAVTLAMLPLRGVVPSGDLVLVIAAAIAVAGSGRVRGAPLAAATTGAVAFTLALTPPPGSAGTDRGVDRLTGLVVFAVGLLLARLGQRWRTGDRRTAVPPVAPVSRAERRRARSLDCLRSVGRVAGEVAGGDSASFIQIDVARSLVELLDLRDCRYESAPCAASRRPVLTQPGWLTFGEVGWSPYQLGLPTKGFDLLVRARGRVAGRYVCLPRRQRPAREDSVLAALALVDQAATAGLIDPAA
ncbi:MAG TPA: DUF4118 domain-containing protein [Acidimicrobiales bacterium]|nr:DUF4118 domain-containing protein [Acidimicrobiales bacterium]